LLHGYIDFIFKDDNFSNDLSFTAALDEDAYAWARQINSELESTLRNILA
jgi:hypothetical protein